MCRRPWPNRWPDWPRADRRRRIRPLRDEGESYAEALRAAGTPVDLRYLGSLTHGFANLFQLGGDSMVATTELISALRAHLSRV